MSILVVGAIHHDVIVDAPRLPREDETLPGSGVRYAFGGKGGNQAVAAGRLGRSMDVSVAMAACVGGDAPGDNAVHTLQDAGVDTRCVQRIDAPTGMSVAISLPDGGYGAVIVSSSNLALDANRIALPDGLQWLVLQNELPEAVNVEIARRAKSAGVRILHNAAPACSIKDDCLPLADIVVVNRVEAADLLSMAEGDLTPDQVAASLANWLTCDVVLTLGAEGVVVADSDITVLPAHQVKVVSTHGAGDAFVGALAVRLAKGAGLVEAARFANAAAALHVSSPVDQRASITADAIADLAQSSG